MNQDRVFEVAKELFIESIMEGIEVDNAIHKSILAAKFFVSAFEKATESEAADTKSPKKLKGCPACYGSGGKIDQPCLKCNGKGKVLVTVGSAV